MARRPGADSEGTRGLAEQGVSAACDDVCAARIWPELINGVLGILAAAREPLVRSQLISFLRVAGAAQIGLIGIDRVIAAVEKVLWAAEDFFTPQDPALGADAPYRFFNTSFREFLFGKLGDDERRDCHRLIAGGCGGWRDVDDAARDYTLKHRVAHWQEARAWSRIAEAFLDLDFVVRRIRRFGFAPVYEGARMLARLEDVPDPWRGNLSDWERFLRWRINRLQRDPEVYGQEMVNEFAPVASAPWRTLIDQAALSRAGFARPVLSKKFGPPALPADCHDDRVTSVAFSGDGRWVASGSGDGAVKVWEAASGRLVADCTGHQSWVATVAFSCDGRLVASGSDDRTVKVWEAASGRLVAHCPGHQGGVRSVSFSGDGRCHASGSADRTVKVWETASGRLVADWTGHQSWVASVSFSGDGRWVASGSFDGSVRVWEAASGRPVANCPGHQGCVWSVSFSGDGRWVASGSFDGTVKVWEAATGRLVANCPGHQGGVRSVAFSGDGRWIASGSDDRTVKLWEISNGGSRAEGRCVSTLLFGAYPAAVAFVASSGRVPALQVCDGRGQAYRYEIT